MTPPAVATSVWLWAAFDPVLIGVAAYMGWTASQFGKVFIAAMVALVVSVIIGWVITAIGLPWFAPVGRDYPTLFPVRTIGALIWATLGYLAARARRGASGRT